MAATTFSLVARPALAQTPSSTACASSCRAYANANARSSPVSASQTFSHRWIGAGPRIGVPLLSRRSTQHRRAGISIRASWAQEAVWAVAPVTEVDRVSEQLFQLVLDVSGYREIMDGFTHPGQYVQAKLGNNKATFLAIASTPTVAKKGRLEFLIKNVEGSTAGLLCSLGKGDTVDLSRQVSGNGFNIARLYPVEGNSTVLLFATGSGISPIRSLIESGFEANKRSDVRLYYGARNLDRMAYQDRFKSWESSGVKIIPVLSQPHDDWSGDQGYVQAAFGKSKGISNSSQAGAILCGHSQMAKDVTSLLLDEGVDKAKILMNF